VAATRKFDAGLDEIKQVVGGLREENERLKAQMAVMKAASESCWFDGIMDAMKGMCA